MKNMFISVRSKQWPGRVAALVMLCALLCLSLTPVSALAAAGPRGERAAATGQSFFDDLVVKSGQALAGDAIVYNGDAVVEDGGVIQGSLIVYSGDVAVESGGVIRGDLTVWSGDVVIDGRVDGNISAVSGDVEINEGAEVQGDVSTVSGEIDIESGASVAGNIVRGPQMSIPSIVLPAPLNIIEGLKAPQSPASPDAPLPPATVRVQTSFFDSVLALALRMIAAAFITLLITGLLSLIFHLRPTVIDQAQAEMRARLAPSFAFGFGANIGLGVLIAMLNIICCLLPLAALPALLLFGLNLLGLTVAARTLGQRLAPSTRTSTGQPVAQVALGGMILVGVLAFLWALMPFLRWPVILAGLVIAAPGVGAFIRPWLNRERWNRSQAANAASQAAPQTAASAPMAAAGTQAATSVDIEPAVAAVDAADAANAESGAAAMQTTPTPSWVADAVAAMSAVDAMTSVEPANEPIEVISAPPPPADDFTRIVGIGRTWDQRLKMAGVTTFAQLAAQTPESVAAILGVTAQQVIEDDFIGQAQAMLG